MGVINWFYFICQLGRFPWVAYKPASYVTSIFFINKNNNVWSIISTIIFTEVFNNLFFWKIYAQYMIQANIYFSKEVNEILLGSYNMILRM